MEKTTKERILEEAVRLFSRRGYMGTSMSDIAGQLGITKAALYKHYTGKQEILDCIIQRIDVMELARMRQLSYLRRSRRLCHAVSTFGRSALRSCPAVWHSKSP